MLINEEFEAEQLATGKIFFRVTGELPGPGITYFGHWAKTPKEAEKFAQGKGYIHVKVEVWK